MSGWFAEDRTISVELGECLCPGTPHSTGDVVELRSELDLDGGLAVLSEFTSESKTSIVERLGRAYLRWGVSSWTFVDENGAPIPVTPERISRLRWSGAVYRLADRAAELYGEAVLNPLVNRESGSSPSGRSDDSTSPTLPSSRTTPKQ